MTTSDPVPAPRDPGDEEEKREFFATWGELDVSRLELTAIDDSMRTYGARRGWL